MAGFTALVLVVAFLTPAAAALTSPGQRGFVSNIPLHAEFTPNDSLYGNQWGLPIINAPRAWDVTLGSHNTVVAVVDTGVWYTDTDIAPNMWSNVDGSHGWDFISNTKYPMDQDTGTWHGTGVAGVIGAVTNNNYEISGVCQCSVMAVRALGPNGEGSSYNTSQAIRWAVDHVKPSERLVINLSLGTNTTPPTVTDIQLAIDYAWAKGALIVGAAGNSGSSSLDYPASLPDVVAVGAIDQSGRRASFSNYGTGLSFVAPGVDIVTLADNNNTDSRLFPPYYPLSGTSLATPFVSGVAGLLWSRDPSLTNQQVWDILNRTANPVNGGYNTQYGWGVIDAWNALNSLNLPFVYVNPPPTSISRSSTLQVSWSVLGPSGLRVSDTHLVWGTSPSALGNATASQSGFTRQTFNASGLQIPSSASALYFQVVATVNGTNYASPTMHVDVSSLPDFLFVLFQLLSSNLLILALFILALAGIVAFVPQRRARARRAAASRARTYYAQYPYSGPPGGPPTAGGPPMQSETAVRAPAASPPPLEFVRPAAPAAAAPPAMPAQAPPAAPTKKRCPNCGTIVNADNMFCFFCGQPFR
jgi:subtilisin family serine protease